MDGYICTENYIKVHKIKINDNFSFLLGLSNSIIDMDKFLEWAKSNFEDTSIEESDFDDDFCAIVIYENINCVVMFENSSFFKVPNEPISIGSGNLIAKTAMNLGLTSKDAITEASKLDSGTNNNITTVSF